MFVLESQVMLRPVILAASVWLLLFVGNVRAGRLPQRYLPSQQYLAPQAGSQLHYHGVGGGQSHARIGGIGGAGAGVAGGFGGSGHRSQQQQIPIVRSDYQSDASGNYNFG